jgi:hypothetical protein
MATPNLRSFTAFAGWKEIACGSLASAALAVKRAAESGCPGPLLIFDDLTGRVQDVDTRGTDAETLSRLPQEALTAEADESRSFEGPSSPQQQRGRGRPKLGVTAREVTLLPRHWEWLSAQPGGASVALRKLVDEARRRSAGSEGKRMAQERAYQFMSTMAGDLPGFEESTRALFAGDTTKLMELMAGWPEDVRDYALRLASDSET